MELFTCDAAVQNALLKERPKKIVEIINAALEETNSKANTMAAHNTRLEFVCLQCREEGAEGRARAFFSAPPPTIVFCANRLRSAREVEEAMVHELIHAYDFIVRRMDITESDSLACSEIRAARESECYEKAVLFSKYVPSIPFISGLTEGIQKRCVQKNAIRSTQSMFPEQAKQDVEAMFHQCYEDHSPFD